MANNSSHAPPRDLQRATYYTHIPACPVTDNCRCKSILFSSFFIFPFILLIVNKSQNPPPSLSQLNDDKSSTSMGNLIPGEILAPPQSRVAQGVSEKVSPAIDGDLGLAWTNAMLTWQRTSYHFQPEKNWMNDPTGPLFYKGWYHFFYQYNPDSVLWGNITWGHAVSRNLIHWLDLPYAMVRDKWYDSLGVWTGSATILHDGRIMMLYTGVTKDDAQVQCLAYPANLSDPFLLEWVKDPSNPVMHPPSGIGYQDFRDPTTAWLSPDDDKWRITIGSKVNKTGFSIVYETKDFLKYELLDGFLHEVPGMGMWECIDFYPVSLTEENGLDTSANGPGIKHLIKASVQDEMNDYYALGTYDPINNKWTPDDPELDIGIGLRYDYGKYYASKTFYDPNKRRRILWAWVTESSNEDVDILKGWSGVQSIPRTIVFDQKTGKNILQWPIKEVESLRSESHEFNDVRLGPGSIIPLKIDSTSQVDIVATFEVDNEVFEEKGEADTGYDCATSGGSSNRGVLGPFGVVVLADETLSELTPIYFYVAKGANGKVVTHLCADELRSSEASDVDKTVYGSKVRVLDGEKLSLRSLVDHSIVESFAQRGRTVITSRVYPTKAINEATRVFLFNNATGASVTTSVKIWKMDSANIQPFPLDQL